MADAADDRDVAKSVRPVGPQAIPSRSGDAMRRLADLTYPLKPDGERRYLSVGRGITLSGEVNSCDKLLIEGSVDAKLTNCRAIEIAESGLFKGSTSIDEAEIRGRFEGDLIVRNRLLIKATGRVSGTIRYGPIQIECGGQIFGDIQKQPADELRKAPCRALPAFVGGSIRYSLTWIMRAPGAGVPAVSLRAETRPTDLPSGPCRIRNLAHSDCRCETTSRSQRGRPSKP